MQQKRQKPDIDDLMRRIQHVEKNWNVKSFVAETYLTHKDEVCEWLKCQVGLPQYYDIFIENGFDDMDTISV